MNGQVRLISHAGSGRTRRVTVHGHGGGWDARTVARWALPLVGESLTSVFGYTVERHADGTATVTYHTD